jgi:long-chain acyl-CoA synthetase
MDGPAATNLGHFFAQTARRTPDRVAIVDLWGGQRRSLTYAELDHRTDLAGGLLASAGVRPGDRVALLVGNRAEFVEVFFGAMRIGAVPVPLNVRQPAAALSFMIRDAGASAVVLDPDVAPMGMDLAEDLGLPIRVALGTTAPGPGWISYDADLGRFPIAPPALSPDGIALQPYTAGSTGRAKGVRLTHRGMLWAIELNQRHWPSSPEDSGLVAVPLFHKNAMRGTIKPMLFAGGRAVIMPRFEPRAFLQALAQERVTFAGGVPAVFAMMLEHRDLIETLDFTALRSFSVGSAVVPIELIDALERAFPGVKVKEAYGLTEGGGPLRAPIDGRPMPRGSCGVPAPEHEVRLVDGDGNDTPTEGELWTRSPYVTDGYHNLPELSQERIIDGWLRTGDIFRIDAHGFYHFMGRVDDMFSCGGENIYPKEVENILFAHPAVKDACVVPVEHPVKGFVPCAMVAVHGGAKATAEDIKAFALENGPAYAHPRTVQIVASLPLTGAGKVDRRAVREMMRSQTVPPTGA